MSDHEMRSKTQQFIVERYSLQSLRQNTYNAELMQSLPNHDWGECVHMLTIISENGIPWCAKCGAEPVFIEFSRYVAKGVREFYDIGDINSVFLCTMEEGPDFVTCECDKLVWQDQALAQELLADDLAEAKQQLQHELAGASLTD
ncbi:hypothetical protein [Hyphobacterium sp.]|uniref:hypothetical protein n=1 Tax=Hyphobacterium sp. TaxID=2004662 RepID=UPI003748602F